MTDHTPYIDFENLPAPSEGFLVKQFITVRSVDRSRAFYSEVLGGQVVLEENPCMVKLSNSWVIMNPGGGPTPDKPDISVVDYEPGSTISSFLNLRVADIQECYERWSAKGAEFVTPPIDRGAEIRCYMRDPDGYLIEVGQATGLLEGRLAKSPSFWLKTVDIIQKYERVHGVVVPVALESRAQLRVFGSATLRMTYEYSEIEGRQVTSQLAQR